MFEKIAKALAFAAAKVALDAIEEAMTEATRGDNGRSRPRPVKQGFGEKTAASQPPGASTRTSSRAGYGFNFAPQAAPRKVSESVTAVLKRQIPVRDEPPRSWIGGLPMLPDDVVWPRAPSDRHPDKGEIPLNFLAQIACADLPLELWGGLGPREGWLVFFAPIPAAGPRGDFTDMRVFHTKELGKERPAPADKQPVGQKRTTEGLYPGLIYRRCPVDIVCMDNHLTHSEDLTFNGAEAWAPMPANLTQILYGDVPCVEDHWRTEGQPFNWASLALTISHGLEGLERKREKDRSMAEFRRKLAAERAAKGGPPEPNSGSTFDAEAAVRALAAIREEEAQLATVPEHLDKEGRGRRMAYVARRSAELAEQRACLARFGDPFDAQAFDDFLEQEQAARDAWLVAGEARLRDLLEAVSARPPHDLIDDTNWAYLNAILERGHNRWFLGHTRNRVRCPEKSTRTLWDLIKRHSGSAIMSTARDLYFAGPEERGHLPGQVRAAVEASARAIWHNRPPRMGGQFQPVQDSSTPQGKVLLLQLVNDDTTGMNWGDSGALFAWIDIDALERGDFSKIRWWTENT
jgi:hypothetical protein